MRLGRVGSGRECDDGRLAAADGLAERHFGTSSAGMRLGQEVAGKGIDVAPDASEVVVGGNGDAETERGVEGEGRKGVRKS